MFDSNTTQSLKSPPPGLLLSSPDRSAVAAGRNCTALKPRERPSMTTTSASCQTSPWLVCQKRLSTCAWRIARAFLVLHCTRSNRSCHPEHRSYLLSFKHIFAGESKVLLECPCIEEVEGVWHGCALLRQAPNKHSGTRQRFAHHLPYLPVPRPFQPPKQPIWPCASPLAAPSSSAHPCSS